MVLATYFLDSSWTPGSLNDWLNSNDGYADDDLIKWATIDVLKGP